MDTIYTMFAQTPITVLTAGRTGGAIPWIVFAFSMGVVLVSFVSVFFPSLILVSGTVSIPGIDPVTPDPYETGPWAAGVATSCIMIFGLLYMHRSGRLPGAVTTALRRLFAFEMSKRTALAVLSVLVLVYAAGTASELGTVEQYEDYTGVKQRVDSWSIQQAAGSFEPHVRYFLLHSSMTLFGNYKVVPFLASIALLLMTYLLAREITGKRFAGIVSVILLMQSSAFLTYDTTVSYTNFWILFYVISLYMASRFWPLSAASYLASLPAKALTAAFLPMSVYFILRCPIPRRQRIATAGITAGMIAVIGSAAAAGLDPTSGGEAGLEEFNQKEFWAGFTSFAYQLRFDGILMLFCIPLIVGLFIASRNGIRHAESMMVLIAGMLIIAPLLTGLTNQTNQPYRFVPLVVFFAVGVGVLLSRLGGDLPGRENTPRDRAES